MNAKERARRSDSLYYDHITRRNICDRVAAVESENEELRNLVQRMWSHISSSQSSIEEKERADLAKEMQKAGMLEGGLDQ